MKQKNQVRVITLQTDILLPNDKISRFQDLYQTAFVYLYLVWGKQERIYKVMNIYTTE